LLIGSLSCLGSGRSGVGLETVNASTEALMPLDEVTWRFQSIEQSGAVEVRSVSFGRVGSLSH
jgi:hypothetical protein